MSIRRVSPSPSQGEGWDRGAAPGFNRLPRSTPTPTLPLGRGRERQRRVMGLAATSIIVSSITLAQPLATYVTPDTPQGLGRYPAIMEVDPGLVTHTVYRPQDLAALGNEKLPIVAFGNGACINVGNRFRPFLSEIASHGFLTIAIGPIGPKESELAASGSAVRGPPAPGSPTALLLAAGKAPAVTSGPTSADTTAAQLIDAINWAVAENTRSGSRYFGRIDTAQIAVMGQSCGGLQAIDAAHDPRVKTLGVWNSGAFTNDDRAWEIAAARATKASLKTLHTPALYITGDPSEVAFQNAEDDFTRIEGIPIFRAWREKTGHSGTYREPHGGAFAPVGVAWLKWQLKGDKAAGRMFTGADCGLCINPEWHVKKKLID